jgi:hypothetical protein
MLHEHRCVEQRTRRPRHCLVDHPPPRRPVRRSDRDCVPELPTAVRTTPGNLKCTARRRVRHVVLDPLGRDKPGQAHRPIASFTQRAVERPSTSRSIASSAFSQRSALPELLIEPPPCLRPRRASQGDVFTLRGEAQTAATSVSKSSARHPSAPSRPPSRHQRTGGTHPARTHRRRGEIEEMILKLH